MGFAFCDDRKDLDFLAGDVIVDADLFNAESILRSNQPAKTLDSTFGELGWLVAKMYFESILHRRSFVRREAAKLRGGGMGQDDLTTHLATV